MRKNSIKIVFVGDARVGKTSMIKNSLSDETYEERNPGSDESVLNPISITNESQFQSKNLILIDTSSKPEKMQSTMNEIRNSDSVILIYDMDNESTQINLGKIWLPLIQQTNPTIPIVLIGNKLDLVVHDEEKYVKSKVRRVISHNFKFFKVSLRAIGVRFGVFG